MRLLVNVCHACHRLRTEFAVRSQQARLTYKTAVEESPILDHVCLNTVQVGKSKTRLELDVFCIPTDFVLVLVT